MNTAPEVQHLLQPLVARAQYNWSSKGFPDRAAEHVLLRLGVTASLQSAFSEHDLAVMRAAWIDAKALSFFNRHPESSGIEIECGISTRFHRLSNQSSWPRFAWLITSSQDVDKCIKGIFPSLDNFTSIGSKHPFTAWKHGLISKSASAAFIIAGEQSALSGDQLKELIASLLTPGLEYLHKVELIVCHQKNSLSQLNYWQSELEVLQQWSPRQSYLKRLASFFPLLKTAVDKSQSLASHLRLNNKIQVTL
ncbi:hypothetical protein SAMN02745866_02516 [Alteromonadaceae bacterium Bs31]|nr:hypothetical protein SAMN02745866_02516 [Alteromonadaceae bacterium Bs31]